jgi:aryl-alcohol dehydrogenase-like predicted oxidoreductase
MSARNRSYSSSESQSSGQALSAGYRHIDTTAAYFNEKEVGEGLANSHVDRAEVFVGTKSGSPTTATTRRCTVLTRAPGSSASTRSTCCSCTSPIQQVRPDPRVLPGTGEAAHRRQGARHRRQQFHRRVSRLRRGELCWFHHRGTFSVSIVDPWPRRTTHHARQSPREICPARWGLRIGSACSEGFGLARFGSLSKPRA